MDFLWNRVILYSGCLLLGWGRIMVKLPWAYLFKFIPNSETFLMLFIESSMTFHNTLYATLLNLFSLATACPHDLYLTRNSPLIVRGLIVRRSHVMVNWVIREVLCITSNTWMTQGASVASTCYIYIPSPNRGFSFLAITSIERSLHGYIQQPDFSLSDHSVGIMGQLSGRALMSHARVSIQRVVWVGYDESGYSVLNSHDLLLLNCSNVLTGSLLLLTSDQVERDKLQ